MSEEMDRRAEGASRVPLEALVEVGGALGPSFEAQAVNVSTTGMALKTAYLPEVGQPLSCRFDIDRQRSILVSGEVAWKREATKGGEFGIRFTEVDPESAADIQRITSGEEPRALGSKVRLHIDGLAQPMRMNVRVEKGPRLTVDSELGFLQMGKPLELEDAGLKRPAVIDRVDVEVDPSSKIPQLVVTLRYQDVESEDYRTVAEGGTFEATSDSAVLESPGEQDGSVDVDLASKDEADPFAAESKQMKGPLARGAEQVAPMLGAWVKRAATTAKLLAGTRLGKKDDAQIRRVTAPPPGGGLHTEGRRVVRGSTTNELDDVVPDWKAKFTKRNITLGATALGVLMLGAVALKRPAQPPSEAKAATKEEAKSPSAIAAVPPGEVPPPAPVEPVIAAPPPPTLPPAPVAVGGPTVTDTLPTVVPSEPVARQAVARGTPALPFGDRGLTHGNVLRLKMDGPIESIQGAPQATGFTVVLPHRKSLEPAGPLAAKDPRIGEMKVTNSSSGAELSVNFADGVPNYVVRSKGDVLEVVLAPPKTAQVHGTVANATRPESAHHDKRHATRHKKH